MTDALAPTAPISVLFGLPAPGDAEAIGRTAATMMGTPQMWVDEGWTPRALTAVDALTAHACTHNSSLGTWGTGVATGSAHAQARTTMAHYPQIADPATAITLWNWVAVWSCAPTDHIGAVMEAMTSGAWISLGPAGPLSVAAGLSINETSRLTVTGGFTPQQVQALATQVSLRGFVLPPPTDTLLGPITLTTAVDCSYAAR